MIRFTLRLVALAVTIQLVTGCSTEAQRGAAQGAGSGAAIGAVGGAVSALVFGGDIAEGAARGAVWGGSTGAVSGGIRGAEAADRRRTEEERRREQELAKLRKELGDDAYLGLEALVDCKQAVAMAYFQTAQQSDNRNHVLAGHWLEILAWVEQGRTDEAYTSLPDLVAADPKVKSVKQAETLLQEALADLATVREDYGIDRNCA